jgi:molybdate transport system substrate-binding protein
VPGIDHITPLPPEVQKLSIFSAGVAATTSDSDAARAVIAFLSSLDASESIKNSGLEPIENH